MPRTVRRVRGLAYAAAVAASLVFGATAAFARPAPARACADPTAQGSCASQSDCRKICNRLSNGLIPFCDGQGCCTCQKL